MACSDRSGPNWSGPKDLADDLRDGKITLTNAITQFAAATRQTFKVIEEFATEQAGINLERKARLEKMEILVNDLSEKCQGLQQELLLKEERYDEKCREVERYRVISELFTRATVTGDPSHLLQIGQSETADGNNNVPGGVGMGANTGGWNKNDPGGAAGPKMGSGQGRGAGVNGIGVSVGNDGEMTSQQTGLDQETDSLLSRRRTLMGHTKMDRGRMHISDYVGPMNNNANNIGSSRGTGLVDNVTGDKCDNNRLASAYIGGPCRRPTFDSSGAMPHDHDSKIRTQLESIGGINIHSTRTRANTGVVPIDRLHIPTDSLYSSYDRDKKVKIAIGGQSNQVMSSSKNTLAQQMKQKAMANEMFLHQQVAQGQWNRLASRRKKVWPF